MGARVVGDTFVGQLFRSGEPVAAPLADIRRAETVRFSGRKTAVVAGVVAVSLAVAVAIAVASFNHTMNKVVNGVFVP